MQSQINDYISQSRAAGLSDIIIKQNLIASGWQLADIENSFANNTPIFSPVSTIPVAIPASKKFSVLKALGIIFIILVILGIGVGILIGVAVKHRLTTIKSDTTNIENAYFVQTALLRYFSDNQKFPPTLQGLVPNYIPKLPTDASSGTALNLIYTPASDSQDYQLCLTPVSTKLQRCGSKALIFNTLIEQNLSTEFQSYFPLTLKDSSTLVELTSKILSIEKISKIDTSPSLTPVSPAAAYEALYAYPFDDNFAKLTISKSLPENYSQDSANIQQNLQSAAKNFGSQVANETYRGYQINSSGQTNANKQGVSGVAVIAIPQNQVDITIYFLTSQPDQRIKFVRGFLDSVGETAFNNYIQQAKSLWSAGKYPDMLAPANQALTLAISDQDKGIAYYWIGVSYFKQNIPDQAMTNENQAIGLYPNFSGPYITRAAIYMTQSNPQAALADSKKAVALDPNYAWAHNSLGLSYADLGDKTNAIAELEEAVKLDPNTGLFQLNLTRVKGQ